MPKQANLREECTLYFFSKDRYIMLTKVQNGGIPYCDYFNIRYKKVVETVAEGTSSCMQTGAKSPFITTSSSSKRP
jgi:hypothetical protein